MNEGDMTTRPRRRSNSITEYSAIFSQTAPKPSNFIGQRRHPSLSMRNDRSTSFSKLGMGIQSHNANNANESAIDDTEPSKSPPTSATPTLQSSSSTGSDAVGLGRRLSQGARAIMYNGNRLRGESITQGAPQPGRSLSVTSTASTLDSSNPCSPTVMQEPFVPIEAAKQVKRRMSPTGERMLRGELAFH